jgi:MFS transporter, putative metabolite:H+ symporter
MPNFVGLLVMRFLVGIGLAGTNQPFYTLIEFVPHQHRGRALLKLGFAWATGSLLTPLIGLATIDKAGWSLFLFLCSAPSVLSFAAAYSSFPESPRWLVSKGGRNDEALQVVRDAAALNNQDPWAVCPQSVQFVRGGRSKSKWKAFTRLFKQEWTQMILSLLPTFLLVDFLYYSYVQLIHMALSNTDGPEDEFAFVEIALTALSEFVAILLAIVCVDRIGRVPTQALAYFCGGLLIIGVGVGRHFEDATTDHRTATGFLFYLSFLARLCIMAATNITW